MTNAWLIGPRGQISQLTGPRGETPDEPAALFKKREIVRIRRKKHFLHLPELGAVACVVPRGFSPDWAWADLQGEPRPLIHQVGSRAVTYIIAFCDDRRPHLLSERDLLPAPGHPPAEITLVERVIAKEESV